MVRAGLICLCLMTGLVQAQPVCVQDDLHNEVCVSGARQVVTLSPHATELVAYVAGVGVLAGVDSSSDFPVSVARLPKVGDSQRVDLERVLSLEPDLVVAWGSGTSPDVLASLQRLGVSVFVSEPLTVEQVAGNMRALGRLLGQQKADAVASEWLGRFEQLKAEYQGRDPVKVFYQIWESPLMTLGGRHIVNQLLELCGGYNVFSDLDVLAAQVNLESVLAESPELILTSGERKSALSALSHWGQWPHLPATRKGQFAVLPPDVLVRNGPRLIEGAKALCTAIDGAR
ncbi:MAG: cobalamin-binding protein [Limnobacter sp.]|nr:cobalamin-binding protein [Limnobacter sp.]